jgi:hypothetical protein
MSRSYKVGSLLDQQDSEKSSSASCSSENSEDDFSSLVNRMTTSKEKGGFKIQISATLKMNNDSQNKSVNPYLFKETTRTGSQKSVKSKRSSGVRP